MQKLTFDPMYHDYIGNGEWQKSNKQKIRYVRELVEMFEEREKIEREGGTIFYPPLLTPSEIFAHLRKNRS